MPSVRALSVHLVDDEERQFTKPVRKSDFAAVLDRLVQPSERKVVPIRR
jgi:hypothetical protein